MSINDKSLALCVRDVSFRYNSHAILDNINISVPIGCIYGLLGASGCGKTTLLRCVLSRLKQNSGKCLIFGYESGHPKSHVPGPGTGYMPQELGLHKGFTIQETLTYFGRIYGMAVIKINERIEFLIKLLQLPKKTKYVGKLSGGQQRRVSLAIALIHSPPLLILDEPTVGVDPVLRHTIWNHLIQLTNDGYTIIMTTHYIEEARSAGRIGFMRNGKILAEDDPKILLEKFGSITLEEVFLKLCLKPESPETIIADNKTVLIYENKNYDDLSDSFNNSLVNENGNILTNALNGSSNSKSESKYEEIWIKLITNEDNSNHNTDKNYENEKFITQNYNISKAFTKTNFISQMLALLRKEYIKSLRNFVTIVFFLIFPSLQISLSFICTGEGPHNLPIAVFNEERSGEYGDMFINSFDNESVTIRKFTSFDDAYKDIESGNSWALIDINKRFSAALRLRRIYGIETDSETIQESLIHIQLDNSNQIVAIYLKKIIYDSMMRFAESIAIETGASLESIKPPIVFDEPIYGFNDNDMRDYIFPACYVILTFFGPTMATAIAILEERNNGLTDRTLIAGITAFQIFLTHFLVQFVLLSLQITLITVVSFVIFDMQMMGSLIIAILLAISQGFAGILYGLMISSACNEMLTACMLAFSTFFPCIIICGVIWPLQNMPEWLHGVSLLTPWTLSIEAMRWILYRGWDVTYFQVYMGFVSTYAYIFIFFCIGVYFVRKNI